ncbi:hypothetical protein [uncultured Planktosalinus sp.]
MGVKTLKINTGVSVERMKIMGNFCGVIVATTLKRNCVCLNRPGR